MNRLTHPEAHVEDARIRERELRERAERERRERDTSGAAPHPTAAWVAATLRGLADRLGPPAPCLDDLERQAVG